MDGLVTDATRTLEPHAVAPVATSDRASETRLPARSVTTFVWSESDPGPLGLPTGTPRR